VYLLAGDRFLYVVDAGGSERWRFPLGSRPSGSPTLAYDGTVLAGTVSGRLWAVGPNGRLRWSFQASGGGPLLTPALGRDGGVYLASGGMLYSLDYRGVERWRYLLRAEAEEGPVLGPDGTLYLATGERRLLALDPEGRRKWELSLPGRVAAPAVASDGTLYVGASGLHRVSPEGAIEWSCPIPAATSAPVLRADGSIVVGAGNGRLYCLSPEGARLWEAQLGAAVRNPPVASADGTLYVPTEGLALFAFSAEGARSGSFRAKQAVHYAALAPDGALYVGSDDWILYRLQTPEQPGPEPGDWPTAFHDNQHTGRAGALADLDGPAAQVLREMAYSEDEELKQRALDDVERHLRGEGFLAVHLSTLEGVLGYLTAEGVTFLRFTSGAPAPGYPAVRKRACRLLGALASDGARELALESFIRDPLPEVRLEALEALGQIGLDPGGELGEYLVLESRRGGEERLLLAGLDTLARILIGGAAEPEDYRALARLAAAEGSRRLRDRAGKILLELRRKLP
jgi:outer membrane protein assembly factor BamB